VEIRVATLDELRTILDWAADEGWNPGLRDADAFHAADREGFLVGWESDEPIAAISLVRYDARWAFLGLYIVRPAHRGRGHGLAMWRAAMARREGRSVGLDGVVTQQGNYARSGFAMVRRNVRYAGYAWAGPNTPRDQGLRDAGEIAFDAVSRLDRQAFRARRSAFLRAWIGLPGHVGLVSVDDAGKATGLGVIRRAREGWKVGPLLAPGPATAGRLLDGLVSHAAPGDPVFIDVPEPNAEAVRIAERHGMAPVFETARMVAGAIPAEPIERIYGVTTFELG
jgi:hypothetical protein